MPRRTAFSHPRAFGFALICSVCVSLGMPAAIAQSVAAAQIQGVVTDQTGAVLPGAEVTVRNADSGAERLLITDDSGRYRALNLRPGEYILIVAMPGFATLQRSGVRAEVGAVLTVDLELQVAAAGEVITVVDEAPVVETERTGFVARISEESVANLPINGRRWDNFALLTPSVQPDGDFGLVSYRGISGLYNNNMIDGADNNQAFFSEARGRTRVSYAQSQASIKEFEVGVSSYSAEFGRAVGGTINAVTKSGTNDWHGEVFYFLRDDSMNAHDPFQNAVGFPKLPERRQQFGFNFGGALVENELHYFLNYDQQVRNFPGIVTNDRPYNDAAGRPVIDPDFDVTELCDFDAIRCAAAHDLLVERTGPFSRKGHNNVAFGKLDWAVNSTHTLGFQYNWHKWRSPNGIQAQPTTNDTKLANGFDGVRTDSFVTRWQSLIGADKLNEFRFQYGRDFEFQRGNATGASVDISSSRVSFDDGQREFLPRASFPDEDQYQFIDNFTWIRGNHTFKMGVDIYHARDDQINLFRGGGQFRYRSFELWAMDIALPGLPVYDDGEDTLRHYRDYQQAFDLVSQGIGKIQFSTTDWNFYFQDSWKVTPTLTMNWGFRYEYTQTPQPDPSIFTNPTPEWEGLPADLKASAMRLNKDTNNIAPRFGLAWDVGGAHRFVARAGYGVYYGRTSNSALGAGLFENNAITRTNLFFRPFFDDAPEFQDTFCDPPLGIDTNSRCVPPTGVDGSVTLNLFSDDYVRPLVHSWDVTLDIGLGADWNLNLSYLGSRANRLPAFVDINMPDPVDTVSFVDSAGSVLGTLPFYGGDRPVETFNSIIASESTVNSWYHGFVVRLRKRFSEGFTIDSHLTIGKALDDGQSSLTFFAFFSQRVDPRDRALEYGRSTFDRRKQFITNFVWEPYRTFGGSNLGSVLDGFLLSGIVTLRDGRAFRGRFDEGRIPGSVFGAWDAVSTFSANGSGADDRVPWLSRNFGETTGIATFDLRVTKEFRFTENVKVSVAWESFNLFNRVNYNQFGDFSHEVLSDGQGNDLYACTIVDGSCAPGTRTITVGEIAGGTYLQPTAAGNNFLRPRQMQLAFKFIW